nr:hypothetical protein [Tanacetum cinerariifolium]
DDGNGEEDQCLRVSKEQRLIEEEEADELYRDVDINQGRGLQVSQDIEGCHLPMTHPLWRTYRSDIASRWEDPYPRKVDSFPGFSLIPDLAFIQSKLLCPSTNDSLWRERTRVGTLKSPRRMLTVRGCKLVRCRVVRKLTLSQQAVPFRAAVGRIEEEDYGRDKVSLKTLCYLNSHRYKIVLHTIHVEVFNMKVISIMDQIGTEKYFNDTFEYIHVVTPPEVDTHGEEEDGKSVKMRFVGSYCEKDDWGLCIKSYRVNAILEEEENGPGLFVDIFDGEMAIKWSCQYEFEASEIIRHRDLFSLTYLWLYYGSLDFHHGHISTFKADIFQMMSTPIVCREHATAV